MVRNLKAYVEKQTRIKFNEYIKAGNKLDYQQLKELNQEWKDDYAS